MKQIILASASPRRREILEQVGIPHEVIPSSAEEKIDKKVPHEVVQELAALKAEDIAGVIKERNGAYLVIGADTIVVNEGQILGKPRDKEDAKNMLMALQGQTHSVYTGVAFVEVTDGSIKETVTFAEETKVTVSSMNTDEIEAYIQSGETMDKAGSYGIQGRFACYIEKIEGDYYNVVGFPIARVWNYLRK